MASINDVGQNRPRPGARLARFLVIAGIHAVVIFAILDAAVPPAFEGDTRPLYVRLAEATPPAAVEPPPPAPKEPPVPRPPKTAILAAATDTPAASTFVVPPQPAPPPAPIQAAPTPVPALVEAHVDADYLDNPKPVYPSLSRRLGEQGTVSLRVHVAVDGSALGVELSQTSGHSRLDSAARDAVARWRFVPARRGDRAVDSWVVVPITFQLKG
ncbi:MAG TPA: energy transducer TonB [Rhodocyclaceae bacterium]|nr:energy transducer TonB [Rhodocyclaceae bacterium]